MKRSESISGQRKCSGFTLLETVIAMSLLTLLLAVVWSVFGMFTKYDTKGKRAAAKSALVRSMHRQLRDDLIAAVGISDRLPQPVFGGSDGQEDLWQPQNGYFVGTSSQMHFVAHVARQDESSASRDSDSISLGLSAPPTELFRVISYEPRFPDEQDVSDIDESFTPMNDIAGTSFLDDLNALVDETPIGIDRHVRNWEQYVESRQLIDEELESTFAGRDIRLDRDDFLVIGDTSDYTESAADRAMRRAPMVDEVPEIRSMFIRYFDGTTWASNWDSSQKGRLPIAIEIGFDLDMKIPEPQDEASESEELGSDKRDAVDEFRSETSETIASADTIVLDLVGDPELQPTWATEFRWVIALDSILPTGESTSVARPRP